MAIPKIIIPQELIDASYTVGPKLAELHKAREIIFTFTRKEKRGGRLHKVEYHLSARINGFHEKDGLSYAEILVIDPQLPEGMDPVQKIPRSLIPQQTIEAAKRAIDLETHIREENRSREP